MLINFLHELRHLIGWAPSKLIYVSPQGFIQVQCTICGRKTYIGTV